MRTRSFNEEVLFVDDHAVRLTRSDLDVLKQRAATNRRNRMRLCAHREVADGLHEMFIVHERSAYLRPHKHLNKIESAHVIEGSADLVLFDETGNITEATRMGDYSSGRPFYHRMSKPQYHTFLITSDLLVFHETTLGPFRKSDSVFAPWAPDETDGAAVAQYMEELADAVERFRGNSAINGPSSRGGNRSPH